MEENESEKLRKSGKQGLCVVLAGLFFFAILGLLLLAAALFLTTSRGQDFIRDFL